MTTLSRSRAEAELFTSVAAPALLVGLIGAGIQLSRSPRMHEAEAAAQGLRLVYRLIDLETLSLGPEALPDLLSAAQRAGFAGLNITYPCKQTVIPLLDDLSPDARALGAVNTIVFANGKRIGHNTDWWGFAESFRHGLPNAPIGHVMQLGAGGAGSAVAHALLTLGIKRLTILDTDGAKAAVLAQSLAQRFGDGRATASDIVPALEKADGLVNTTPVGMAKYPGLPLPAALLRPNLWVADIVYFPLETELLKMARGLGCRTLDGSGMNVFQAAQGFRLFTGREPDVARMAREFAALGGEAP
jgi:shikimate dehydrogenase